MHFPVLSSKDGVMYVTSSPRDVTECSACKRRSRFSLPARFACFVSVLLLVLLCSVQICWNLRLNQELVSVRNDVDLLMRRFRTDAQDDQAPVMRHAEGKEEDSHALSAKRKDDTPASVAFSGKSDHIDQQEIARHVVSRRSAPGAPDDQVKPRKIKKPRRNKGKKGKGKGNRRGKKAVAIHIQSMRSDELPPSGDILATDKSQVPRPNATHGEVTQASEILDGETMIAWKSPPQPRFNTDHLLSRGYITVPADGFYFVYSQVVFQTNTMPEMVAEIGVKTQGAVVFSKCLFSRPNNPANSLVTCTSNGVVYLRTGEGISVKVKPPGIDIFLRPETTYFGAFYLGK